MLKKEKENYYEVVARIRTCTQYVAAYGVSPSQ
jgi:hypothetical protein